MTNPETGVKEKYKPKRSFALWLESPRCSVDIRLEKLYRTAGFLEGLQWIHGKLGPVLYENNP